MPYAQQTSKFGIPVPVAGQILEAAEQLKTFNIIDNQLQAGSYGISRGVYEDGAYTLSLTSPGNYAVYLNGSGGAVALRGVVGGGFVESISTVIWTDLLAGSIWYLSVDFTSNIYADKTAFIITKSTTAPNLSLKTQLYLAKVDYTGATPTIDTKPVGKLYISDIVNHMVDFDNPHEVTAAQVGNGVAQWNAYQLYNKTLATSATSANIGHGYVYNGSQFALQLVGNVSVTGGAITNHIPQFSDTTGYRMKEGLGVSTTITSTGTNSNIPTELAVYNAMVSRGDVYGPASSVDGNVVLFDGVTGKLIKDGLSVSTSIASTSINTEVPTALATYNAVVSRGDVYGPVSSVDGNIVLFDGVTGKLIKDGLSVVTILDATGSDSNIATEKAVRTAINTIVGGSVTGPAGAVDGHIVQFDGVSGTLIKDGLAVVSSVGVSGSSLNIPNEVAVRNVVNSRPITTITDLDYTATSYDYTILFSTGASDRNCYLPVSSSNNGLVLNIKKIDSGIGKIVVDADSAETIDGSATVNVVNQWDVITIQNNGSNWFII